MHPNPIPPKPGQESVWDYPRPARWEETSRHIQVIFNGVVLAETRQARRVLETSHPPSYFLPPDDVQRDYLTEARRKTFCEWKGWCSYYNVSIGAKQAAHAVWCYNDPTLDFAAIRGYYAFYAPLMDACYVDGDVVTPQPGNYYGGWITQDIVGPFKGGPGTRGW